MDHTSTSTVETEAKPAGDFYLIDVSGCTEPEMVGPFASSEERDEEAKRIRAAQDEEDALFWLDMREGVPVTGAYSGGFFQGWDEGDEAAD